ncbi:bifunctional 4-hydroxy-2-oxoglutarate aldolase/2-dehydro-3-deoxy-phosphogluconate aldolase, partial [Oxalobacteraceae bacterium OM1]
MFKLRILQFLAEKRLIAIVRAGSADVALQTAEACIAGGAVALEIAFTTPDTLEVIRTLVGRHGNRILVGAGTVLDAETARMAILAGARFMLAPNVEPAVIRTCNRYQVVSIPGASTPTEIVSAMEAGADLVKVFPGEAFGPQYFKALLAPLPYAPLMPSGGVTLENLEAWFQHGAVAVSAGSSI